ncbi:MAG: bacteriohopanetetrol glucosamine biosynthesis glycosyltransferase HpnI [Candidatus Acidiferrum sp.]
MTVRIILLILAVAPLVYYLFSCYCAFDYFRAARSGRALSDSWMPPVSILKPVRGADREAYENFASFCRLDYPEYEIVFAATDPEDPAVPVIQRLQRNFPDCNIRLVTSVAHLGANNKVNNLCSLVHEATYELLVMSDSDVRVDRDYLRNVVAPFADPQVGAVTSFYRSVAGRGLVSELDALGMYTDSAPAALVARKLEGKMKFAFGWTMATTKNVLSAIGGFEAMVNHHSDDFELGNRVSRLGYQVVLMQKPVWMICPEESLEEYLKHELRWSIGLRNVRPVGYLGMVFTQGLPWALLAAILAGTSGWTSLAVAYPLAYLVLRFGVVWITGVWGLGDAGIARKLYLVPARDAFVFAAWVAGLFCDKIVWRGFSYRVRKGLLVPAEGGKDVSLRAPAHAP